MGIQPRRWPFSGYNGELPYNLFGWPLFAKRLVVTGPGLNVQTLTLFYWFAVYASQAAKSFYFLYFADVDDRADARCVCADYRYVGDERL